MLHNQNSFNVLSAVSSILLILDLVSLEPSDNIVENDCHKGHKEHFILCIYLLAKLRADNVYMMIILGRVLFFRRQHVMFFRLWLVSFV